MAIGTGRGKPTYSHLHSSECIEQGAIDVLNNRFQVTLDTAAESKHLPDGDFKRPVPLLV